MSELTGLRAIVTGGASASTTGTALSVDGRMSGLRLRPSAQDPAQER